jgi:hypothetical protein
MMAIGVFGIGDTRDYAAAYIFSVTMMTLWTGTIAILPAAIAIALAEAFAWRSVLYYFLVGGLIALIGDRMSELVIEPTFTGRRLVIMLAAGFVGGFVYWAIAGQRAGDWGSGDSPPRTPAEGSTAPAQKSNRR